MTMKIEANADGSADIYVGTTLAVAIAADGTTGFPENPVSGTVLQEVVYSPATMSGSTSSTSFVDLGSGHGFTPKSAASKIVIEATIQASIGAVAGQNTVGSVILKNSVSGEIGYAMELGTVGGTTNIGLKAPMRVVAMEDSGSTSLRNYSIRGKVSNASASLATSFGSLKITELAP
jgi:hypothetical protein